MRSFRTLGDAELSAIAFAEAITFVDLNVEVICQCQLIWYCAYTSPVNFLSSLAYSTTHCNIACSLLESSAY